MCPNKDRKTHTQKHCTLQISLCLWMLSFHLLATAGSITVHAAKTVVVEETENRNAHTVNGNTL